MLSNLVRRILGGSVTNLMDEAQKQGLSHNYSVILRENELVEKDPETKKYFFKKDVEEIVKDDPHALDEVLREEVNKYTNANAKKSNSFFGSGFFGF